MFYLLLILGLVCSASGVFVVGFGIPIRETVFGSALLVAGSVAITGGLVTVGLAAAVAELRMVIQALRARLPAVPRPPRPAERKEGDMRPGLVPLPPRPAADTLPESAPVLPASRDSREPAVAAPSAAAPGTRRPEWLRRAFAELSTAPQGAGSPPAARVEPPQRSDFRTAEGGTRRANPPAHSPPAPDDTPPEPRHPQPAAPSNIFDTVWPAGRGRPAGEPAASERPAPAQPSVRQAEPRPAPAPSPAPQPAAAAPRADVRPASVLKSGVIDEMAYTLFTDGSIEAQMPEGTVRFSSIEALREHLEKHEG